MEMVGIAVGIFGTLAGALLAYYFYRKGKLDSETMERNLLGAILGALQGEAPVASADQSSHAQTDLGRVSPRHRPSVSGNMQSTDSVATELDLQQHPPPDLASILAKMESPDDIVKRILVQYEQGVLFWPELGTIGIILINAGQALVGLCDEGGEAGWLILHGKIDEAREIQERVNKKIKQLIAK
jgi:hypothetical protein